MSFIDDVVSTGKAVGSYLAGDSTGASLARVALLAYAVNRMNKNTNPSNGTVPEVDKGVRLQLNPNADNSIPIVYGSSFLGGAITDAQSTNDNKTMTYCVTICEKTGTKLSDGLPSVIKFNDVYWNDQRIVFKADGITADYTLDRDSNVDYSIQDLVKVYCYSGSSASPVIPDNYINSSLVNAYTVMPEWTSAHTMDDLVFAIIQVNYNKEKNVTAIPTLNFHVTNTMTLPGDCLYDYMTNTRYGAGIDPAEINS